MKPSVAIFATGSFALVLASIIAGIRGNDVDDSKVYRLQSGTELVVAFIGSSSCHAADSTGFIEAIGRMKDLLSARAGRLGYRFATVGVALDWRVKDGLQFLDRFGPFDEVVAGRNWLNTAAISYVWTDLHNRPAIPQVVISLRQLTVGDTAIEVGQQRVLLRKSGVSEIMRWIASTAPLPSP